MSQQSIPDKINAVVAYASGDFRYEEVNIPEIEYEDEIIIKIAGYGICANDVFAFSGADRYWETKTKMPL